MFQYIEQANNSSSVESIEYSEVEEESKEEVMNQKLDQEI